MTPMLRMAMLTLALCATVPASAQTVGVALDGKAVLEDGELKVLGTAPADAAVFLSFSGATYTELGRVTAPTSFQGPPSSVAIAADGRLALVTAFRRIDPANPSQLAPDRTLSVIDLTAKPLRTVQTLELAAPPSSVAIAPSATMALVPHTSDDSVTVLSLANGRAEVIEKIAMEKGSAPIAAAFSPDGRRALISFPNAGRIGLFAVENGRLKTPAIREMSAGVWPTALAFCGKTGLAVVSNYGKVTGDADTISLIDAGTDQPRVVDTVSVGPSPEGIACSPDGRYVAASVQNMSTTAKADAFHSPHSQLVLVRIENRRLRRVAEAPFGGWAQGVGFLDDSRTVLAQSMNDRAMPLFRITLDDRLAPVGTPVVFKDTAPAGLGISGR